ncbi:RNA-directed DNA polymerase [Hyella patelloides LEGE 07179]|uniref:RNA-directed DNA polymerase n=1 Tax=Hyella patelloides LEGE 07179 TaxID=945734 RepID=A0A563VWT0_9CYAN|nr:group II intron reverse transcriptase/maturase [Hyella patelloides]VEP15871.1 RNA-directed DNA polymerase [Hyella patelloides LEGE 07179]
MNELNQTTYEWQNIPWHKLERFVYKLQKRIYRASSRGDILTVHKLQRLMVNSRSAKCLAVRRVTQDNQGKKTAGVDGVKSLSPEARLNLVSQLKLGHKAKPVRRVWIPKPGKTEKRGLGIPTIFDRALQALVKLALEPQWEALFESNSYGFRPGRSCQDAIVAIHIGISQKPKYVLDADIAQCFDKINHQVLLDKLQTFPKLRRQIKAWLKAGIMDKGELFSSKTGTPQGGTISPLLANIALHGMENKVKDFAEGLKLLYPNGSYLSKDRKRQTLHLIRYADDFVCMHEDLSVVLKCQDIIAKWLETLGLSLKSSKTRLVHTLKSHQGSSPGFDFLGFNIRQYPVGKYHSRRGYKTLIKPSKDSQKVHYRRLGQIIDKRKAVSQGDLIAALNPIIKGWSNYFSSVCSKRIFSRLDELLYNRLCRWAKRRHHNKSWQWISRKYWRTIGNNHWCFALNDSDNPFKLFNHADTKIVRHIKVKGIASPMDGDLIYWSSRMGKHPQMPSTKAFLLRRQKGKCNKCGLYFREEDRLELDHILPKSLGGKNRRDNLQLLHKHCHHQKTRQDTQNLVTNLGTYDKSCISEERSEGKLSRSVLQTSRRGDSSA